MIGVFIVLSVVVVRFPGRIPWVGSEPPPAIREIALNGPTT